MLDKKAFLEEISTGTNMNRYVKIRCKEIVDKINNDEFINSDDKFYTEFICKKCGYI